MVDLTDLTTHRFYNNDLVFLLALLTCFQDAQPDIVLFSCSKTDLMDY